MILCKNNMLIQANLLYMAQLLMYPHVALLTYTTHWFPERATSNIIRLPQVTRIREEGRFGGETPTANRS
jgi:hypothetical protein